MYVRKYSNVNISPYQNGKSDFKEKVKLKENQEIIKTLK
jgi:hypothetical protein